MPTALPAPSPGRCRRGPSPWAATSSSHPVSTGPGRRRVVSCSPTSSSTWPSSAAPRAAVRSRSRSRATHWNGRRKTSLATSSECFALLDARLGAAVQAAVARGADPHDALRGLYISDEQALGLAADGHEPPAPPALGLAAERLGPGPVDHLEIGR